MLTRFRREVAFYRDLLRRVRKDMENAARTTTDPKHREWLEKRARRIEQHLVRGMPEDWTEEMIDD